MERRLSQGDYVPDGGGGLTALGDGEEVLARVLFRLTAHRVRPALGSRLYLLGREKPSARQALAAQEVAEALREETDLQVRAVELEPGGETARVAVYLDWRGKALTAQVEV